MDLQNQEFHKLSYDALDKLPVPVLWFDENANFIEVNQKACADRGFTREEFLKMTIFDINPNMHPDTWPTHWDNKIKDPSSFETTHKRKDGKEFPVDVIDNFVSLDGKIVCCAIIRDITDRKRKEGALRGALMEIRELKEKLEIENNYLNEEMDIKNDFGEIVTNNDSFKKVLKQVEQVADTSSTVLITGESGTEKELLVRAIHQMSVRSERQVIKVACGSLSPHMIESELVGHEKNAFVGALNRKIGKLELAHNGTLFLEEIDELALEMQTKLLQFLKAEEFQRLGGTDIVKVNLRIIATSTKDLMKEVEQGRFREELYFYLNVFPIQTIALRDRIEDIPPLTRYFCEKIGNTINKKIINIPESAIDKLMDYDFPGNVRELENIVERGVINSRKGRLNLTDFNPRKRNIKPKSYVSLEDMQRNYIARVLQHTNWRVSGKSGASGILGIPPTTLFSKIKKLGIKRSNKVEFE